MSQQNQSWVIDHGAGHLHKQIGQWGAVFEPAASVYFCQALASVAANLMLVGVYYYTAQQFQWGISRNLMLASGMGGLYVLGALSANAVSERLGRRRALVWTEIVLIALALVLVAFPIPKVIVVVMLSYSACSAVQWPVIESLVSALAEGQVLARRLTLYNLCWSSIGSVTVALMGFVIQNWHAGIFVLAAVTSAAALGVAGLSRAVVWETNGAASVGHAEPEPELLEVRSLALWLARISLPSSYIVVTSLSAMMPTLPVMVPLATRWRTLVGSAWFIARFCMFWSLGVSVFWHTRPRLILAASGLMLAAFLGVTIRPSELWPVGSSQVLDLMSMIVWQVLLGAALGIIYSASLYFGMVLSQGSTEHGGYHEALIGLGGALGPAAAAAAHMLQPGGIGLSVATVAGLIAVSLMGAGWVGLRKSQ